jgi:catechol 2,3-dioxygenase-like lactoylglutathione lyase family enzyme
MKLLRAATLTVADLERSAGNYTRYFDYGVIERGEVSGDLAASWGAPASAGCPYAILQPASGAEIYLRLIEQPPVAAFRALRSYGWNAIEICVADVLAANARMQGSPFEIIGPPREIDGLPAIYPMQVKGPDEEIVYLTQIRDDLPAFDLPRATSPIDRLFILVLGCRDMKASLEWMQTHCGLQIGRDEMQIVYTMLAKAYGTPIDEQHTISTMIHGRDVFLELDQYPPAATARPVQEGMLAPGCAIGTLWHPEFDSLPGPWITPPAPRTGPIYQGRRAATMRDLDGALIEIVEA